MWRQCLLECKAISERFWLPSFSILLRRLLRRNAASSRQGVRAGRRSCPVAPPGHREKSTARTPPPAPIATPSRARIAALVNRAWAILPCLRSRYQRASWVLSTPRAGRHRRAAVIVPREQAVVHAQGPRRGAVELHAKNRSPRRASAGVHRSSRPHRTPPARTAIAAVGIQSRVSRSGNTRCQRTSQLGPSHQTPQASGSGCTQAVGPRGFVLRAETEHGEAGVGLERAHDPGQSRVGAGRRRRRRSGRGRCWRRARLCSGWRKSRD